VPEDYRFTKGKQKLEDQKRDIEKAFGHHAQCVPLFISAAQFDKLVERKLVTVTSKKGLVSEVTASPDGTTIYKFTLVRLSAIPPGCEATMWAVYYHPQQSEQPCTLRHVAPGDFPRWPGLRPVYGMTNPEPAEKLGVRAAVAGQGRSVDGKTLRGAHHAGKTAPHLLSAILHQEGVVVAQRAGG
jgi:hypothetical protein